MPSARHRAATAVLAVALPGVVFGDEPKKVTGRFKLGPVYLTPRFVVRSAGRDDNVYNSESQPVGDTSVAMSPTLEAGLPVGRRLRLYADGGLAFNYFAEQETERSTDAWANGRAELDLGPLTFFAGTGLGRYKQRYTIEVDERFRREESRVNGGLIVTFTRKLTLTGEVRQYEFTHDPDASVGDESVAAALDRRSKGARVTLRRALTDQTGFSIFADGREDEFSGDTAAGMPRARTYLYAAGFDFGQQAVFNGSLYVGVRDFPETEDQAVPPYRGPYLEVGTTVPFVLGGRLSLGANRDVFYAVNRVLVGAASLHNSYTYGRYSAELAYELPFALIARGLLGYERADYLLPYESEGESLERQDKRTTYGFTLLRAVGRTLRIGGTVQWSKRESNYPGQDYAGTRYGLTLELTP